MDRAADSLIDMLSGQLFSKLLEETFSWTKELSTFRRGRLFSAGEKMLFLRKLIRVLGAGTICTWSQAGLDEIVFTMG